MKTNDSVSGKLTNNAFRAVGRSLPSGRRFAFPPILLQEKSKAGSVITLMLMVIIYCAYVQKTYAERSWQQPVQITHSDGEYVATEFDALTDRNGRIHFAFTVHRYRGERLNNRVMYQLLDKDGTPLTDPVVAVGDFQRQYRPSMILDEAGNVHLVCPTTTEDWAPAFYYTSFDCNGNRRINPVPVEGTLHDTISWDNPNMFSFHRRSDGLFVIASLPTSVLPGDELACSFVGYLLFDSTGTLQKPAQLLWHDRAAE